MIQLLTPDLNKRYAVAHGCTIDNSGFIVDSPGRQFDGQVFAAFRLWDLREFANVQDDGVYQWQFDRAAMRAFGLDWFLRPDVDTYTVVLWEKRGKVNCSVHYQPIV